MKLNKTKLSEKQDTQTPCTFTQLLQHIEIYTVILYVGWQLISYSSQFGLPIEYVTGDIQ